MLPVSENPVCRKPAFGITYSPAPVPLEDRGYLTTFWPGAGEARRVLHLLLEDLVVVVCNCLWNAAVDL